MSLCDDKILSVASRPEYFSYGHNGSVVCVERSPFFRDIVLSVGGWNWAIWREGEKVSERNIHNHQVTILLHSIIFSHRMDHCWFLVVLLNHILVEPGLQQGQVMLNSTHYDHVDEYPFLI